MGMGLVKEREKAEIRVGHVHLKITELSSMQPIRSSVTHLAIQHLYSMPSPLVMFESTMQARHDLLVARLVLWFKIPPADHEIENN